MSEAFSMWRKRSHAANGKARALTALARVSDRRRSERAEMRLALKTWRRNACGDGGGGDDGGWVEGGGGADGGGGDGGMAVEDGLEAVAGVFVEAAAAFSTASSVRGRRAFSRGCRSLRHGIYLLVWELRCGACDVFEMLRCLVGGTLRRSESLVDDAPVKRDAGEGLHGKRI